MEPPSPAAPLAPPPPPPQGASGQQSVGGVVGVQNRGVAPPPPRAPGVSQAVGANRTGFRSPSPPKWDCVVHRCCQSYATQGSPHRGRQQAWQVGTSYPLHPRAFTLATQWSG